VALAEAEVGGDFYDVFPLGKKCTILVVGDLSGKGLAAAAQVATVRNMLRATLYLGGTLAAALTDLNTILADNDLLTGFATLFVGAFDPETGRLVYVNCGQEPGLVRRARTGLVEELPPTGPVMGTFAGVVFTEETVKLASGDALALFTDGFTEAGPNRADMLGIEGVAALLAAPLPKGAETAAQQAEELSLRLIAGVDQYAQAGVRDDVYLLLAVVE
jgi:serine phosphatase RsbU (regulator of sigma subunit)